MIINSVFDHRRMIVYYHYYQIHSSNEWIDLLSFFLRIPKKKNEIKQNDIWLKFIFMTNRKNFFFIFLKTYAAYTYFFLPTFCIHIINICVHQFIIGNLIKLIIIKIINNGISIIFFFFFFFSLLIHHLSIQFIIFIIRILFFTLGINFRIQSKFCCCGFASFLCVSVYEFCNFYL